MPYLMVHGSKHVGVEPDRSVSMKVDSNYQNKVAFRRGDDFDTAVLPTFGWFLGKNVTYYPPLISQPYWLCDDAVRDLIEEMDPGIHRFFPFEIRESQDGEVVTRRHILQLREPLEAIDLEHSDAGAVKAWSNKDGTMSVLVNTLKMETKKLELSVRISVYRNRHLWLESRSESYDKIYISNEMKNRIENRIDKKFVKFLSLTEKE